MKIEAGMILDHGDGPMTVLWVSPDYSTAQTVALRRKNETWRPVDLERFPVLSNGEAS